MKLPDLIARYSKYILLAVILLLIGANIILFKSLKDLKSGMKKKNYVEINLAVRDFQHVNDSLRIGDFSVTKQLTGVKITGRLLNYLAIDFTDVTLEFEIGTQAKEVTVRRIPSGYAKAFELYIPDLPLEKARECRLKYKSGHFTYRK